MHYLFKCRYAQQRNSATFEKLKFRSKVYIYLINNNIL
jgi:hypothetical protein